MNRADKMEKEILRSYDKDEWKGAAKTAAARRRYQRYAKAMLRKDKRINIRISAQDLEGIQSKALEEGLPYQTLISSVIHKYVSNALSAY